MEPADKFLAKMYHTNSHFVFTVTRDFVRPLALPNATGSPVNPIALF
jgi:hypothetical protein